VTALAVAFVQLVVPAVVTSAVESSPLVRGQPVTVTVDTSVTGVLLHAQIDRIRITGQSLVESNATIAALDVTLSGVSITDRTFDAAGGTLSGVVIDPAGATPITLPTVALAGASAAVTATISLDAAEATSLIESHLRSAGAPAGVTVSLAQGHLDLLVAGHSIPARIDTTAQTATLVVDGLNLHETLLQAPAGGAWTIGDVEISPTGIQVSLDLSLD
jgi:hypothetical protein